MADDFVNDYLGLDLYSDYTDSDVTDEYELDFDYSKYFYNPLPGLANRLQENDMLPENINKPSIPNTSRGSSLPTFGEKDEDITLEQLEREIEKIKAGVDPKDIYRLATTKSTPYIPPNPFTIPDPIAGRVTAAPTQSSQTSPTKKTTTAYVPPKKHYTTKLTTTSTIQTTEESTTTTESNERTTEKPAPIKAKKRPIKKVKLREGIPDKKETGLNPELEQLVEERVNCEIGSITVSFVYK